MTELRTLVADLGKDGGRLSPSVYDTAQVVRLHPPTEGAEPALDWLIGQQAADGGWGDPAAPYARAVPTLATLLAFQQHPRQVPSQVVDAGCRFLQEQAPLWQELPIDALPIATEMILPYLLDEATRVGLSIEPSPYHQLYQLRRQKCQQISKRKLVPSTPPMYSWEALGQQVELGLLDESGGIGHSPAATAAWLSQAKQDPALAAERHSATTYLQGAAAATGVNRPGVVPNVWPITGFEMSYGPYALLIAGLYRHPSLQEVLRDHTSALQQIMVRGHGVSFGDYFMPDVDETAVALAALHAAGCEVDGEVMEQFRNGSHFHTFPHELNPSVLSNAHALYALAVMEERSPEVEAFLRERQCADGHWLPDKWHSSWLYTTMEALLAFEQLGYSTEVDRAVERLLATQQADGGWGSGTEASATDTSYA
ncbi:MAG: hypothetical protein KDE19_11370, partial [Caldilineaceae bacterium]|nr:hypothetical protein [Caldilineaceae bacterium]